MSALNANAKSIVWMYVFLGALTLAACGFLIYGIQELFDNIERSEQVIVLHVRPTDNPELIYVADTSRGLEARSAPETFLVVNSTTFVAPARGGLKFRSTEPYDPAKGTQMLTFYYERPQTP